MDEEEMNEIQTKIAAFSSLFIFQSYEKLCTEDEQKQQYPIIAPLCVGSLYEEEFFDRFHLNYFGEFENDVIFLVSARCLSSASTDNRALVRAIIRTSTDNYELTENIDVKNEDVMLQNLFNKVHLPPIHRYIVVHHIQANEKILDFDKSNDDQCGNKVAIIFQRHHQSTELEMLRNNTVSSELVNFLELISERVQLNDFKRYRGDLDTRTDQHGSHSYFSVFDRHSIMFNVAPMIPSAENDPQCIQRKSLIGNAFICIVFQEEDTIFHPDMILSKVTQIFITVQPIYHQDKLYYKIGLWRRADIDSITNPPILIFKHDPSFRSYFLSLLLNSMYTIFRKDYFHLRITQQRQRLKNEYMIKLGQSFNCYLKHPVLSIEVDHPDSDSYLSEKSSSAVNSPVQRRRLRLVPKLISAFGISRPKSGSFTSTSTNNDSSTNTSSPVISSVPMAHRHIHHHEHAGTQSAEVIPTLIAQLPNSIGLDGEKSSSSTSL